MANKQQITIDGDRYDLRRREPTCAANGGMGSGSHTWIDDGHHDNGGGAIVYRSHCRDCGMRQAERRSYLGSARRTGPRGDGRDWTAYADAAPAPEPMPDYPSDEELERLAAIDRKYGLAIAPPVA